VSAKKKRQAFVVFAAKLRNEHRRDATRVRQQHSPTKLV